MALSLGATYREGRSNVHAPSEGLLLRSFIDILCIFAASSFFSLHPVRQVDIRTDAKEKDTAKMSLGTRLLKIYFPITIYMIRVAGSYGSTLINRCDRGKYIFRTLSFILSSAAMCSLFVCLSSGWFHILGLESLVLHFVLVWLSKSQDVDRIGQGICMFNRRCDALPLMGHTRDPLWMESTHLCIEHTCTS